MIIPNQTRQKQDVWLCIVFSYKSSSEEEVVLINVEFSRHLQDSGTHLEAEEQLMALKQTTTRVAGEDNIHS